MQRAMAKARAAKTVRVIGWLCLPLLLGHCAMFGSEKAFETIPLNKVYPYPTDAERSRPNARVALATHYLDDLPELEVGFATTLAQSEVERILGRVGARVVERDANDFALLDADAVDYAIVTTVSRVDHSASWTKPTNWLFKSEEELAEVPGTCTHRAEVELIISSYALPSTAGPETTYVLIHDGEAKTSNIDTTCPFPDIDRQELVEKIVDEGLQCLQLPIMNRYASRGWVTAERQPKDGTSLHRFRTTIGSVDGAESGRAVEVHRVQFSTAPDGSQHRREHKIADGVMSNRVAENRSWIEVDVDEVTQPILDGDLVRVVYRKSGLSPLTDWSGCGDILAEK